MLFALMSFRCGILVFILAIFYLIFLQTLWKWKKEGSINAHVKKVYMKCYLTKTEPLSILNYWFWGILFKLKFHSFDFDDLRILWKYPFEVSNFFCF